MIYTYATLFILYNIGTSERITWIGGYSNNWEDIENYDKNILPSKEDIVLFNKEDIIYINSNVTIDSLISRNDNINLIIRNNVNVNVNYLATSEKSLFIVENNSIFNITETIENIGGLTLNNKSQFITNTADILIFKSEIIINDSKLKSNFKSCKILNISNNSEIEGNAEIADGSNAFISTCILNDLYLTNKGTLKLTNSTVRQLINNNEVNAISSNLKEIANSGEMRMTEYSLSNNMFNNGTLYISKAMKVGTLDNNGTVNIAENSNVGKITNAGVLIVSKNSTVTELTNSNEAHLSDVFASNIYNNGSMTISGDSYTEEIVNNKTVNLVNKAVARLISNSGKVYASGGSYAKTIDNTGVINITQGSTVKEATGIGSTFASGGSCIELLIVNTTAFISENSVVLEASNAGVMNITKSASVESLTNYGTVFVTDNSTVKDAINRESISLLNGSFVENLANDGGAFVSGSTVKVQVSNNGILNVTRGSSIEYLSNHGRALVSENSVVKEAVNDETMNVAEGARIELVTNNNELSISNDSAAGEVINNKRVLLSEGTTISLLVNNDIFNASDIVNVGKITNNNVINITGRPVLGELTNNADAYFHGSPTISELTNRKTLRIHGNASAGKITNEGTVVISRSADAGGGGGGDLVCTVGEFVNNGAASISYNLTVDTLKNYGVFSVEGTLDIASYAFFDTATGKANFGALNTHTGSEVHVARTLDALATFRGDVYIQEYLNMTESVTVSDGGWIRGPGTVTNTGKLTLRPGAKVTDIDLVNAGEVVIQSPASLKGTGLDNRGSFAISDADKGSCEASSTSWKNSGTMLMEGVLTALAGVALDNTGSLHISSSEKVDFDRITNKGLLNITPGCLFSANTLEFACDNSVPLVAGENTAVSVADFVVSKCAELTIPWSMTFASSITLLEGSNLTLVGQASVRGAIQGEGTAFFNGSQTALYGDDLVISGPDVYFSSGKVLINTARLQCNGKKTVFSNCTATFVDEVSIVGEGQVIYKNATLNTVDEYPKYINASVLVQGSSIVLDKFESITFGGRSDCVLEDTDIQIKVASNLAFYGPKTCYLMGNMRYSDRGLIGFHEVTVVVENETIITHPNTLFQSSRVEALDWVFESATFTISDTVLHGNFDMNNQNRAYIADSKFVNSSIDNAGFEIELTGTVELENTTLNNSYGVIFSGCAVEEPQGSGSALSNPQYFFLSGASTVNVATNNSFCVKAYSGSSTAFSGVFEQRAGGQTVLEDGSQVNFTGPYTHLLGTVTGNGTVNVLGNESDFGFTLSSFSKLVCGGSANVRVTETTTIESYTQITFQSENPALLYAGLNVDGEAFFRSEVQCPNEAGSVRCSSGCTLHVAEEAEFKGCPVTVAGVMELDEGGSLMSDNGTLVHIEAQGKMVVPYSASLVKKDSDSTVENNGLIELHCSTSSAGIRNLNAINVLPCTTQQHQQQGTAAAAILSHGTSEASITVSAGATLCIQDGFESKGSLAGAGTILLGDGGSVCGTVSALDVVVAGSAAICGPASLAKVRFEDRSGSLRSGGSQAAEARIGTLEARPSGMVTIYNLSSVVVEETLGISNAYLKVDQSELVLSANAAGNATNAELTGTGTLVVEGAFHMAGTSVNTELHCGESSTLYVHADSAMPYGGVCNGTIELVSGSTVTLGNYTMHSSRAVGSGKLSLQGKSFVYGCSTTGTDVDVVLDELSYITVGDNLTVFGKLSANGGTLRGGTVINRGEVTIDSSSCEFTPVKLENYETVKWVNVGATERSDTVFSNSGLVSILSILATEASLDNCVTLENTETGRAVISTGSAELRYFPGTITNHGELALEGGTTSVSVSFTNGADGVLNFSGGNIEVNRASSIEGSIIGSGTMANKDQYQLRFGASTVLSPGKARGDVGELRFSGAGTRSGYVFKGRYDADIAGTASMDVVRVEDALLGLTGFTINVTFAEAFCPKVGDTFVILEHVSSAGTIGGSIGAVSYYGIDTLAVTHHKYEHNITIEVVGCPFGNKDSVKGCTHCQPGEYYDNAIEKCVECGKGTYSNIEDAAECTPCPKGSAVGRTGATSCEQCRPGYSANETGLEACSPCEIGTFQSEEGATTCLPCSPGYFYEAIGGTQCKTCDYLSYQPEYGQSECIKCPEGMVSDPHRVTCKKCNRGYFIDYSKEECVPCPAGSYMDDNSTACVSCQPGLYQSEEGAYGGCSECSPGYFQELSGQKACNKCPPGTFQSEYGKEECVKCGMNYYQDSWGATECKSCSNDGYTLNEGSTKCESQQYSSSSTVSDEKSSSYSHSPSSSQVDSSSISSVSLSSSSSDDDSSSSTALVLDETKKENKKLNWLPVVAVALMLGAFLLCLGKKKKEKEKEEKKSIYTPIDIGQRPANGTLSQEFDEETVELSDDDDDDGEYDGKNFDPTILINSQSSSVNSDMLFFNSVDLSEDFIDTGSTAVFHNSKKSTKREKGLDISEDFIDTGSTAVFRDSKKSAKMKKKDLDINEDFIDTGSTAVFHDSKVEDSDIMIDFVDTGSTVVFHDSKASLKNENVLNVTEEQVTKVKQNDNDNGDEEKDKGKKPRKLPPNVLIDPSISESEDDDNVNNINEDINNENELNEECPSESSTEQTQTSESYTNESSEGESNVDDVDNDKDNNDDDNNDNKDKKSRKLPPNVLIDPSISESEDDDNVNNINEDMNDESELNSECPSESSKEQTQTSDGSNEENNSVTENKQAKFSTLQREQIAAGCVPPPEQAKQLINGASRVGDYIMAGCVPCKGNDVVDGKATGIILPSKQNFN